MPPTAPSEKKSKKERQVFSEGLLFQFLLQEFLNCAQLFKNFSDLQAIEKTIQKFSFASSMDPRGEFYSGCLIRLHHYLSLLSLHYPQNNHLSDPVFNLLSHSLQETLVLTLSCRLTFTSDPELTQTKIEKIQECFKVFCQMLPKKLLQYQTDENVLFFLLRRQKQFEGIFEKPFVSQFFGQIFPNGLQQASAWMEARFSERHFNHLIPQIQQKMAELPPLNS